MTVNDLGAGAMADYTLVPYRFTAHRQGDPETPLRMADIGGGTGAATAVARCLAGLQTESAHRVRKDNDDKSLNVASALHLAQHVWASCNLGSKGLHSSMNLAAAGGSVARTPDDVEDFGLRTVFLADDAAKAGLFLCERQGQYSIANQLIGLLKRGIQHNLPNIVVDFHPVQESDALKKLLEERDVLEAGFKGYTQSREPGGTPNIVSLKQTITVKARGKDRGGLGKLRDVLGRGPREAAEVFGVNVSHLDQERLTATAQVDKPHGKGVMTIALEDGTWGSISYPIHHLGAEPPSDAALYETAGTIVADIAIDLGLGTIQPAERASDQLTALPETDRWEVPADELPADRPDQGPASDPG